MTPGGKLLQRKINDFERLVKLRTLIDEAEVQKLECEFENMLMPYTKQWGITKDEIDEELADAQARLAIMRVKGRQDTPEGKATQHKISDFKRLIELRGLTKESHDRDSNPHMQKKQSESSGGPL